MRGLSCLGVLLYHVRVDLWIGWREISYFHENYSSFARYTSWLSIPTPFFGYAVLLFFLISGFCIHYPYTSSAPTPRWKNYFFRRFLRIYPTYLISIGFTAVISFICLYIWNDQTFDPLKIFSVISLTQNYPIGFGQFHCNPSLWTIPLEFEFYILYPAAFYLISNKRFLTLWLIVLGLSVISIILGFLGHQWLTFTSFFLWPSWLLGAWIAQLYREQKLDRIKLRFLLLLAGLTLMVALISKYKELEAWSQYVTWTFFYAILLVLCISHPDTINRIMGVRFVKAVSWIGKISFSLYLIHFPLFKLFGYLHREIFGVKPANFLITLFYLLPVIFVAWLFFRWVENPIHLWSKKKRNL